jgi:hypothetical protein
MEMPPVVRRHLCHPCWRDTPLANVTSDNNAGGSPSQPSGRTMSAFWATRLEGVSRSSRYIFFIGSTIRIGKSHGGSIYNIFFAGKLRRRCCDGFTLLLL